MIALLRAEGNDNAQIEAKRASGGFPESVAETLSAFANTPGGGDVLFGVDETGGFALSGVYDTEACQQAVVALARTGLAPSIAVMTRVEVVDGVPVVVVHVPEADAALKPVRVRRTGLAYLRQYDGDYPISEQEEQVFIADRGQPTFDETPVTRASLGDLDAEAVRDYVAARRLASAALSRMEDAEVLLRTGVMIGDHPSLAGLLALGVYPQQFFANLGIQASLTPPADAASGLRTLDSAALTGPIPRMLADATAWVYRATGYASVEDRTTGEVVNQPTYPALAVRELVANALIHRDLGPHALNAPVTLRVEPGRLVISNPGGLFGLRLATLGLTTSHLRNGRLAEICQYVMTADRAQVVERLGTGIPTVRRELARAHLAPPRFIDQGVRFTAMIAAGPTAMLGPASPRDRIVSVLRRSGPSTQRDLAAATGLTPAQVKFALRRLVDSQRVRAQALDGRANVYSVSSGN